MSCNEQVVHPRGVEILVVSTVHATERLMVIKTLSHVWDVTQYSPLPLSLWGAFGHIPKTAAVLMTALFTSSILNFVGVWRDDFVVS